VQVLLRARHGLPRQAVLTAVRRAGATLAAGADQPDHPALWHDKDIYAPLAVVRAAVLGALWLCRSAGIGAR